MKLVVFLAKDELRHDSLLVASIVVVFLVIEDC